MSPRESVEAVLRGEKAERIPFTIYENKLPQCSVERKLRNDGMCIVRRDIAVYKTRMPNVKITSCGYWENGKKLFREEYETPVGKLHTITEPAGFTSWTHKRFFSSREDYKALLFFINDMQFAANYDAFAIAQNADGGDSFFRGSLGYEPMQQLISGYMDTQMFCMEWFDNRDEIMKLYDAITAKRRELYPICADSPATAFNYGGNVTPEVLGLDRFEKYYVPHYDEAAEILHKKGKFIGVHFDANCRELADAIAGSELDYIEAFTPFPDTDMTLADARQAWGDKVLWINFPSSIHLESLETMGKVTRDLIEQIDPTEKFIMGITEDVPADRWQENLLAISKVLGDYGKL